MMRRKNRCIEFCFLENPIFRRISSFGAFRCIEIFDHSTFLKEQLLRVIDIRFKIQILNIKSRWWWNQRVFGCFIDGNRWRNFARWSYRIGFSSTPWLIDRLVRFRTGWDWSETGLRLVMVENHKKHFLCHQNSNKPRFHIAACFK